MRGRVAPEKGLTGEISDQSTMRQFSLVIQPVDGEFHPAHTALVEEPEVTRVAIDHLNQLADGTGVTLFHMRGSRERIEEVLGDTGDVESFEVTAVEDGYHVYVHFEPEGLAADLLEMTRQHELVLDMPIEALPEGGHRLSVIGDEEAFREAVADAPDGIRVELERIADYQPDAEESLLTDRQREILETAVSEGYYDVPRRASRDDLAETLDLSGGTVSEHLRKIEATVLREHVS